MTKPNIRAIKLLEDFRKGCDKAIKQLKKEPLKNAKQFDDLFKNSFDLDQHEKDYDSIKKALGE